MFPGWRFTGGQPPLLVVLTQPTWKKYIASKDLEGITIEAPGGQLMIADGDFWDGVPPVVLHELMHYYFALNSRGFRIPLWYEEGTADFFSTIAPYLGQIQVGVPPYGRVWGLHNLPRIALYTVMMATRRSPEYLQHELQFYNEAWGLVDYMRVGSPAAAALLGRYMAALQSMASQEEAVRAAFAEDHGEFIKGINEYVNSGQMRWFLLPAPAANREPMTARKLPDNEGRLAFARVLVDTRPMEAATLEYVEQAKNADGARSPAAAMLAELYYQQKRAADAEPLLQGACSGYDVAVDQQIACGSAKLAQARSRATEPASSAQDEAQSDALAAREFFQRAWSADPTRLEAVTRQTETYALAPGDSSGLRTTIESLLPHSDVPVVLWSDLAFLYGPVDRRKQLHCLEEALLSAHSVATSDHLLGQVREVENEIAAKSSTP
jgi:hypothetical protein